MTTQEKLLKALVKAETKYGNVENDSLARRYCDGMKALRSGTEVEQNYAATRLNQWFAAQK